MKASRQILARSTSLSTPLPTLQALCFPTSAATHKAARRRERLITNTMRTHKTISEYRTRKFKRSIAGQIFRGTFFALAYGPAVGAWKAAKAVYYAARGAAIVASVIVWWALGFRKNIPPQIVFAISLIAYLPITMYA